MAEFTTILDGLEVMMRLGIHPHEVAPQRVVVSVEMTVVYPGALGEDAIEEVLDYDFVRTGIHYIWVRGRAATKNDDTIHAGLDGVAVPTADRIGLLPRNGYGWTRSTTDGPVARARATSTRRAVPRGSTEAGVRATPVRPRRSTRWSTRASSSWVAGCSAPAVTRSLHRRRRWLRTR